MNEKITELQQLLATAASVAKDLAADPLQTKSPVIAALRSSIEHADELAKVHEQWAEKNAKG